MIFEVVKKKVARVLKPNPKEIVKARPLTVGDEAAIAQLEAELFREELRNGIDDIREMLDVGDDQPFSLCTGLINKDRLVGYLLAYPYGSTTDPSSEDEEIVYLSDIAVLEPFRRYTVYMLAKAAIGFRKLYPGRPVEGYSFRPYRDKWIQHQAAIRRFGYRLTRIEACTDTTFDEELYWIRLEPYARPLSK